jgi:hypothetical protein
VGPKEKTFGLDIVIFPGTGPEFERSPRYILIFGSSSQVVTLKHGLITQFSDVLF